MLQNAARISVFSHVYVACTSRYQWLDNAFQTPFVILPEHHMQIPAILLCRLSSLPERELRNTEEREHIHLCICSALESIWHIVGTHEKTLE